MELTNSGVNVRGFSCAGWRKGKYGVAMVLSDVEVNCAISVTSNRVKAAPLLVSLDHVKMGKIRGVVANSGNANAYTGVGGVQDAKEMCAFAAGKLRLAAENFLVASTGIIGRRLDMDIVKEGINFVSENLSSSSKASLEAAKAIMTTDTTPKMISVKTSLKDGTTVEIGAIAKGSGMIAPKLHATMLCFITTDAYVPKDKIKKILANSIDQSFNMTVVDGDTSTNDFVALLANGMAGNKDVDDNFVEALNFVTREIAKKIARDGEGATKTIKVKILKAANLEDARKAARTVVGSNLVKASIYGEDLNWGRIIAALGYCGAEFEPEKLSISINGFRLVDKGRVLAIPGTQEFDKAKKSLKKSEVEISVELNSGNASATAYGCDLTPEYVKINSGYTT